MTERFSWLLLSAVVVRLAVSSALAGECNPQETAKAILELESNFYQMGQDQSARAAFLTYLADDAVAFEPEPVNAKKLWEERAESSVSLKWEPNFVGVAQSCDLVYTTGPSEWRKNKSDEKPAAYGRYVTIWRKQKDGAWKVAVDLGGEVPGPRKSEDPPELVIDVGEPHAADPGAAKKLRQAEKWFIDTAATDSTTALVGSSGTDIRVHRGGVFPAIGREAAALMLSVRRGGFKMERMGGGISGGLDLAYGYGKYTLSLPHGAEHGHYLQIWRADAKGAWKLVLDYQTPLPEKPRPPSP